MELSDAVVLHSREVFSDVFHPLVTFVGKINPFAEITNSGSSSRRRILETPVSETIPAGRVITAPGGELYIVADLNIDYWNGTAIRNKYPIFPVDGVGAVGTIAETLTSTQSDLAVYCHVFFMSRETEAEERSSYYTRFEIFMPMVKSFDKGVVLLLDSEYYRFRSDTWIDGAGFTATFGTKLDNPVQTFTVVNKGTSYNPTTDGYVETTVAGVSCFVEPITQDYEFASPAFTKIEPGDRAISLLKSAATVAVNSEIGDYRVLNIRDFGTWVTCHCRYRS